ncbi:Na+/H+ antiporter [Spirillospora sp. NPDC050679]
MDTLTIIIALMLGTVALVAVGPRVGRPYPVLMTLLGFVLAAIPWTPDIRIDPDMILPLFLPPLIYAAAHRLSWPLFRRRMWSVLALAVVLVLVTTAAVAAAAWALIPGATLAAAVALGAMVAPPDPVAAEAVAGPLRMPRRIITVLKTEGLFNDATALIVFQVAVAAAVTGGLSPAGALAWYAYAAVASVVIGLAIGWATRLAMRRLVQPMAGSALTLVVPFAGYVLADQVRASGVITVVVIALFLASRAGEADFTERLSERALWEVVELLVTGVAFGLIGAELRMALQDNSERLGPMLVNSLAVLALVIGVRMAWMLGHVWLLRHSRDGERAPRDRREAVVMTWCGMRGLATLALALALPWTTAGGEPFPGRSEIVVIACMVIVGTLVVPGLTMPTLVRVLGVQDDAEEAEERRVTVRAHEAALDRLRRAEHAGEAPAEVVDPLRRRQEALLAEIAQDQGPVHYQERMEERRRHMAEVERLYQEMLGAARAAVLAARAEPGADPEVADRVLHRIDLRSAGAAISSHNDVLAVAEGVSAAPADPVEAQEAAGETPPESDLETRSLSEALDDAPEGSPEQDPRPADRYA